MSTSQIFEWDRNNSDRNFAFWDTNRIAADRIFWKHFIFSEPRCLPLGTKIIDEQRGAGWSCVSRRHVGFRKAILSPKKEPIFHQRRRIFVRELHSAATIQEHLTRPGIKRDVNNHIKHCLTCQQTQHPPGNPCYQLQSINSNNSNDLVKFERAW